MIKIDAKTIELEGSKLLIQAEALALLKVLAKRDWLSDVVAAYIIVTEDEDFEIYHDTDSIKQWEQEFQDWREHRNDPERPLHYED